MTYAQAVLSDLILYPTAILLLILASLAVLVFYRLLLHPLSNIPGPLPARITSLYLFTICFLGIECRVIESYHRKYKTSVLRIAPNAVSISDGDALHSIYVAGGGFKKAARYENFKVGGVHTIFSARDATYRDVRAKAVAPIFAMGRVRAAGDQAGIIGECVSRFVERFKSEKANKMMLKTEPTRVDVLALTYRLMMDAVTGYLFNRAYGALDEQPVSSPPAGACSSVISKMDKMSALPFVYAILEAGRFSLLPNRLFKTVNLMFRWLFPDPEFDKSFARVYDFATSITNDANPEKDDTYQSRLLAAGISKPETNVQCMAAMFAGTDSTAVKLVTIVFHLVNKPGVHGRLKEELRLYRKGPTTDLLTLPYLRAVIQEGLRLGMANPARFSRVVPRGGFQVDGFYIPGETDVGIAPYVLHHNPELFPKPFEYHPDRWLAGENANQTGSEAQKRKMERDLIPFSTGSRVCIARNLATYILFVATKAIVESGVLEGARTCTETIELEEYFNAQIKGHTMEIEWSCNV
ncbi:hypothetical protein JMJ35_006728 [Cladonia borealis]|uniref:Cytochrome P450 n=1 Tax=Cladonia borealis TaxID=184061 RepID=A0AA39R0H2_9LECA|nr:hypothetical protein JMJ35_006728 [Cladonia borealis]